MSVDTRLLAIGTLSSYPRRRTRWTVRRSAAALFLVCGGFWLGVGHLIALAQG